MNKYVILEITNEEPLKIGNKGVQNQYQKSKSFIPGSTIRGTLIYYLINSLSLDDNLCKKSTGEKYKDKLLNKLICYNAYPFYNGKLYFPTPVNLKINKHDFRKAENHKVEDCLIKNALKEDGGKLNEKGYNKSLPREFITTDENAIRAIKINKEIRLHHNKCLNQHKKEKDNIFRYEAIKKGHVFRSLIAGENEVLSEIEKLVKEKNSWYVGGSKGSGYGLCTFKIVETGTDYKMLSKQLGLDYEITGYSEEIMEITCLSDCMLRDGNGQPCNYILESELNEIIGKKGIVKLKRVIVNQGYSQGYNTKWGTRYPKESTVKAGSIMQYYVNNIDKEDIELIEKNIYGMRIQEGYGWVAVNMKYPSKFNLENKIFTPKNRCNVDISDINLKNFDIIKSGLEHAKEKWLKSIIVLEKKNGNIILGIKNSSHIENMKKHIKGEIVLDRKYVKDNEQFSVANINFEDMMKYCLGEDKNEQLKRYANDKIHTTKGKLFYDDPKQFIKELTNMILELGGAIDE